MDMMQVIQIIQRINLKQLEHSEYRERKIRIQMQSSTLTEREEIKNHDYISIISHIIWQIKLKNPKYLHK